MGELPLIENGSKATLEHQLGTSELDHISTWLNEGALAFRDLLAQPEWVQVSGGAVGDACGDWCALVIDK